MMGFTPCGFYPLCFFTLMVFYDNGNNRNNGYLLKKYQ